MLATRVRRLTRELERQLEQLDELKQIKAQGLLNQAKRILEQSRAPRQKYMLYSTHDPNVDCTEASDRSKGKAHKRFEFGIKVGITTTQAEGYVVAIRNYPSPPVVYFE